MKITQEEARHAGELFQEATLTDEELALTLCMTKLTLAFFEGKGVEWSLVISPLKQELAMLEMFDQARKQDY